MEGNFALKLILAKSVQSFLYTVPLDMFFIQSIRADFPSICISFHEILELDSKPAGFSSL